MHSYNFAVGEGEHLFFSLGDVCHWPRSGGFLQSYNAMQIRRSTLYDWTYSGQSDEKRYGLEPPIRDDLMTGTYAYNPTLD
jgi:hypothetical protein